MKNLLLFACCSAAVGAIVACAASDEEAPPQLDPTPSTPPLSEGGADSGPSDAALPELPPCSSAGWCVTRLPDADLVLRDIWPVQGHAFAIAESVTLGVKILAWDDADPTWKYIDDNTQNEADIGNYGKSIWVPSDSEVYYAVWPGYVYHGKRAETWTWERRRIPGSGPVGDFDPAVPHLHSPALGVWGTSADDVYAWYGDTILHWKSPDGGAPDWIPEYVLEKDSEAQKLFILSASGSSKNDVWFAGARTAYGALDHGNLDSPCPLAIRKTPEGYRRIVDGTATDESTPCAERPGFVWLGGGSVLNNLQALSADLVVGLRGKNHVTRIRADNAGGYSSMSVEVLVTTFPGYAPEQLYSLWAKDDEAWVTGMGVVLRGSIDSGPSFSVSTLARNNLPITAPLFRIRGTDNKNLWAIGAGYALHKTTP